MDPLLHSNPDVGMPAVVRPAAPRSEITPKTKFDGRDLVPVRTAVAAASRRYWYWIGVTPSCPRESLDCAGLNFPKVNENIIDDPMRTEKKQRVAVIGALVQLTEDKIRLMRERLPRMVMRLTNDAGAKEEPGTGQNLGDNHQRPQRGHPIRIPTDAEIEQRKKEGKPTNAYVPSPNDVPAARFMFAKLCDDQVRGNRGDVYPDCLETTGLVWPDEIDGVECIATADAQPVAAVAPRQKRKYTRRATNPTATATADPTEQVT